MKFFCNGTSVEMPQENSNHTPFRADCLPVSSKIALYNFKIHISWWEPQLETAAVFYVK